MWKHWKPEDSDPIESCAIMTTDANRLVAPYHDRMPVILQRETWSDWLAGPPDGARLLCQPYPADMTIRRTTDPWFKRKAV